MVIYNLGIRDGVLLIEKIIIIIKNINVKNVIFNPSTYYTHSEFKLKII